MKKNSKVHRRLLNLLDGWIISSLSEDDDLLSFEESDKIVDIYQKAEALKEDDYETITKFVDEHIIPLIFIG